MRPYCWTAPCYSGHLSFLKHTRYPAWTKICWVRPQLDWFEVRNGDFLLQRLPDLVASSSELLPVELVYIPSATMEITLGNALSPAAIYVTVRQLVTVMRLISLAVKVNLLYLNRFIRNHTEWWMPSNLVCTIKVRVICIFDKAVLDTNITLEQAT